MRATEMVFSQSNRLTGGDFPIMNNLFSYYERIRVGFILK
ncbi:hypothetical protein ETAE_1268 [Edwardsiella piscicida]|uniref:Uncharacterized protein n=1 Tax=Edwardsiella piscicida TaxID=1263550 RepID=A0AAU8P4N7_EDWPI|nr:hypothetical protein ETAE_1268 [Edwardsiella tarda EIB202]